MGSAAFARDPRAEAFERLGGRYDVRVLEPSPPAVDDGEFYADDPAVRGEAAGSSPVVSPTGDGDLTWDSLCVAGAELSEWCAERWLGARRRLGPLPADARETWESLRRLAVYVLAPARRAVNGKIGLRWTMGGFGTPFFGRDEQLRVAGADLIRQRRDGAQAEPVTSLAAAAAFAGVDLSEDPGVGRDLPGLGDPESPLPLDVAASVVYGDWFGFAASVLEQLRFELRQLGATVSRVQLWPEHFDMAFDNSTANFGCSPGDIEHPEPYLYVGPWKRDGLDDEFWNESFGAVLPYSELLAAPDQRGLVLAFLRRGAALLDI